MYYDACLWLELARLRAYEIVRFRSGNWGRVDFDLCCSLIYTVSASECRTPSI